MRSRKVQQTHTEVRGIDTRAISGSRCSDNKWKTFLDFNWMDNLW